jgi:hypothetical protein
MQDTSQKIPTGGDSAPRGAENYYIEFHRDDAPESGPTWADLPTSDRVSAARRAALTPRLFPSRLTTFPHLHEVPHNGWTLEQGGEWIDTRTGSKWDADTGEKIEDAPPTYGPSGAICAPRNLGPDAPERPQACLPSINRENRDLDLDEIESPQLVAREVRPEPTPKKRGHIEITRGAGVVKVQRPHEQHTRQPPTREQGDIEGLSPSAARRLQVQMAKVRQDHQPVFATLTYPDLYAWWGDRLKEHIEKLWKRLDYHGAGLSMVWKIEIKRRKSGALGPEQYTPPDGDAPEGGCQMPHVHLLIFKDTPGAWDKAEYERMRRQISEHWHSIVWKDADADQLGEMQDNLREDDRYEDVKEDHEEAGTRTERIRSRRGTLAYVSEYISKEESDLAHSIGRYWGIYGRENMPWGVTVTVALGHTEACRMLRAICKAEGIDPSGLPLTRTHLCNSSRPWDVWVRQALRHGQPPDERNPQWVDYIATSDEQEVQTMETGGSTFSQWENETRENVENKLCAAILLGIWTVTTP